MKVNIYNTFDLGKREEKIEKEHPKGAPRELTECSIQDNIG